MVDADGSEPESLPEHAPQDEGDGDASGGERRTACAHWLVFAQHTDRRLPASHSASWNQV